MPTRRPAWRRSGSSRLREQSDHRGLGANDPERDIAEPATRSPCAVLCVSGMPVADGDGGAADRARCGVTTIFNPAPRVARYPTSLRAVRFHVPERIEIQALTGMPVATTDACRRAARVCGPWRGGRARDAGRRGSMLVDDGPVAQVSAPKVRRSAPLCRRRVRGSFASSWRAARGPRRDGRAGRVASISVQLEARNPRSREQTNSPRIFR